MNIEELPGRELFSIELTKKCCLIPPVIKDLQKFRQIFGAIALHDELYFAQYTIFEHPIHAQEYRLDLKCKWKRSGLVVWFGIHITKEEFDAILNSMLNIGITSRTVTWKEVWKYLNGHINLSKLDKTAQTTLLFIAEKKGLITKEK